MEQFVFETTQGQVLEAMDEAAMMDYVRVRRNVLRPCAVVLALTLAFAAYFLAKGELRTVVYTGIVGVLICAFFWIPMLNTKRLRANLQEIRSRRENLTDTIRGKPMRFVFQGDACRMLDGKGEEVQAWTDVGMTEVRESQRLFWLPIQDTAVLIPKGCQTQGTEADFRVWLRRHAKRYRTYRVTDKVRRRLER